MRLPCSMWSFGDSKNTTMSSGYTRTNFQRIEANLTSIALWKVVGAFFSQNGIPVNLYSP